MSSLITLYKTGHVKYPEALHVDAETLVAFEQIKENESTCSYDASNAVCVFFKDAKSNERKSIPSGMVVQVLDEKTQTNVRVEPWSVDQYILLIDRTYTFINETRELFKLETPCFKKELFQVAHRNICSYAPHLHRMMRGEE